MPEALLANVGVYAVYQCVELERGEGKQHQDYEEGKHLAYHGSKRLFSFVCEFHLLAIEIDIAEGFLQARPAFPGAQLCLSLLEGPGVLSPREDVVHLS